VSAPEFLAITGPTASGKTDLSLALAERTPAEVVSMDSRQVYAGMDIGTDKIGDEERARVPHHGLDVVRPDERYSAGRFGRDARRWIREIVEREGLPILVGGTGFFLRAVTDPIFAEPELDEERLRALRRWLRGVEPERLARWVRRLDPERADLAIEGGPQRMGRTLEVALLSGVPLSRWHREAPPDAEGLPAVVVLLDLPRSEMDRRIDDRVTRMVERGLVREVEALVAAGYGDDAPGMSGTGYREITAHLRGECDLEAAVDEIRRNTRRYSRRQLTWFRNQLPSSTVRIDATEPLARQVESVLAAWRDAGGALRARAGGQASARAARAPSPRTDGARA
jgi:tRNA dimethylallyltransferase